MSSQSITANCRKCGVELAPSHEGICPNCGIESKHVSAIFSEKVMMTDWLNWEKQKTYYENHKLAFVVNVVITLGSPFLGLWLVGWTGVIVGLFFSGISYFLGPYIGTKIIEITKGSSV